jgi:hypothetical protein
MANSIRYFFMVWCVVLLFSCKQKPRPVNEITKVELATCSLRSENSALSVDSLLTFNYYDGTGPTSKHGYYTGKINALFWDTLNKKLEALKYKTLVRNDMMVDGKPFEFIVHWKGNTKMIICDSENPKDSLVIFLKWLSNSRKAVQLHQVKAPIRFETTFQNPPKMKIEQVRFPPPIHRKRR